MESSDLESTVSPDSLSDQQRRCSACKAYRPAAWFTSLTSAKPLESCLACRGVKSVKTKKPERQDQLSDLISEWIRNNIKVSNEAFTLFFGNEKARVKITKEIIESGQWLGQLIMVSTHPQP